MDFLTNKEKEILSLVSSGLTTKEIAGKLKISHHTVESHRKNLLRKCQAKNSAELIQKSWVVTMQNNSKVQEAIIQ
jgi:two-component system, NarL family, response regulator NreC